jgi:hypothetical protein
MKTILLYVCAALAAAVSGVWSLSVYTDDDRTRVPHPFVNDVADRARTKRDISTTPSILPGVSDGNLTSKVSVCYSSDIVNGTFYLSIVIKTRTNSVVVVVNIHSTATHSQKDKENCIKKFARLNLDT